METEIGSTNLEMHSHADSCEEEIASPEAVVAVIPAIESDSSQQLASIEIAA